jgi:hypothetical protein
LTIWWKAPFWLVENQKKKEKDGFIGDPARGQADPGSAAVYTMDWPGPVICMFECVGTVSHALEPTDPLVVAYRPTPPGLRNMGPRGGPTYPPRITEHDAGDQPNYSGNQVK